MDTLHELLQDIDRQFTYIEEAQFYWGLSLDGLLAVQKAVAQFRAAHVADLEYLREHGLDIVPSLEARLEALKALEFNVQDQIQQAQAALDEVRDAVWLAKWTRAAEGIPSPALSTCIGPTRGAEGLKN